MTAIPASGYASDPARTQGQYKVYEEAVLSCIKEMPGGTGKAALTLSGDSITPVNDRSRYTIETQSGAGTDDWSRVNSVNARDGQRITVSPVNASHVVTVKHGIGGADQILLLGGRDRLFRDTAETLDLEYDAGATAWKEVGWNDYLRIDRLMGALPFTQLQISSGVITPTRGRHSVAVESGSTDDLVTIAVTNMHDGQHLLLHAADTTKDIVLKGSGGNIVTLDGGDITLDDNLKSVLLERRGANLHVLALFGFSVSDGAQNARKAKMGPVSGADANATYRYIEVTDLQAIAMGMADVRLTTESGVPVSASDRTGQGTLYLTPNKGFGNFLSYWDTGSSLWVPKPFAQISKSLTLTAANNYRVWEYWDGSAFQLELQIWTNDTTPPALVLQDNQWMKNGDLTRRWVGDIRASGSNVTADAAGSRYVYNHFNKERRHGKSFDATDSYNYTTATTREIQGGSTEGTSRIGFIYGAQGPVKCKAHYGVQTSSAAGVGIGLDSSTTYSGLTKYTTGSGVIPAIAEFSDEVAVGYHTLRQLENGQGSGSCTWYGDAGVAGHQMIGMMADFWM